MWDWFCSQLPRSTSSEAFKNVSVDMKILPEIDRLSPRGNKASNMLSRDLDREYQKRIPISRADYYLEVFV